MKVQNPSVLGERRMLLIIRGNNSRPAFITPMRKLVHKLYKETAGKLQGSEQGIDRELSGSQQGVSRESSGGKMAENCMLYFNNQAPIPSGL
jgi:hypothetical protein